MFGIFVVKAPVVSPYIGCWMESNEVLPSAYKVGTDNDKDVYIIRAYFKGALLPGKYVENHGAYVAWGGQEHKVTHIEWLCHSKLQWADCTNGVIPENAFIGGHTESGEKLYIGKCYHNGNVVVGKVQKSHETFYYPWWGREHKTKTFQVLVV